jgi:hypothetical protein
MSFGVAPTLAASSTAVRKVTIRQDCSISTGCKDFVDLHIPYMTTL